MQSDGSSLKHALPRPYYVKDSRKGRKLGQKSSEKMDFANSPKKLSHLRKEI